jgi:branched-chain amino acid transport system ATP-binding protein
MSLLNVTNLAVAHGPLQALWDISLRIEPGERIGLLGANGAGKSTTLGAIVGYYPTMGGRIEFDGRDITSDPVPARLARGIGLVPEGRRLFTDMSVRENLEMGAYLSQPRKQLAQSLAQVYTMFPILQTKSAQAAGTLSGGQQQMVAIGRALMGRPRFLLLDEPFIGVAPIIVQEVMAALRDIAQQGITILLVEQNTHRALEFVDRAYVIENGRSVLEGTRDQLLNDKSFGAKFLGLD